MSDNPFAQDVNRCKVCGCRSKYDYCSDKCYYDGEKNLYDEDEYDNYSNSLVHNLIKDMWKEPEKE